LVDEGKRLPFKILHDITYDFGKVRVNWHDINYRWIENWIR
jgi:hypothetical protein